MHLDSKTYAALLAGKLAPDEAHALSAHLEGECEQCEAFLAAQTNGDSLDGATDTAIARALPASGGEGNDLEFARIQRELRRPATAWRRAFVPAAIAASLIVAGLAGLVAKQLPERRPDASALDGVKGQAVRPIPVRLRFLELQPGGGSTRGSPARR